MAFPQKIIPPDRISGLVVERSTATQIIVREGDAFVPGIVTGSYVGKLVELTADATPTMPSLVANTWYYVYLGETTGATSIHILTTVPDTPYRGTARTMTGDTTKRYIGEFLTNASAQVYDGRRRGDKVMWRENTMQSPFEVLAQGRSSTTPAATVSCAAVVPVTSEEATIFYRHADFDQYVMIGLPSQTIAANTAVLGQSGTGLFELYAEYYGWGVHLEADTPLESRSFAYRWGGGQANSGDGLHAHVRAYFAPR